MEGANPWLWLTWALFGTYLVWVLGKRYAPVLRDALPPPRAATEPRPAWLLCEQGAALDCQVRWFRLQAGGRTVIGRRPRANTDNCHYLYLSADDILEEHAEIVYQRDRDGNGRYVIRAFPNARVDHNNESLAAAPTQNSPSPRPAGEADFGDSGGRLFDGDTLQLGRLSRFRFTHTGPENP